MPVYIVQPRIGCVQQIGLDSIYFETIEFNLLILYQSAR